MGPVVGIVRRAALGAASGVLAGLASAAFLSALEWATETRLDHGWLIWLLPLAGLLVGAAYHRLGGRAAEGSGLLIDEIHEPTAWVPRRMAPLVAGSTVVSHLFGASVGREGTALQMSGSLSDLLARTLRLPPDERRMLLVTALSAGFGGMFGVPVAGAIFGLEVQAVRPPRRVLGWRIPRWEGLRPLAATALPATIGAFTADRVVQALGHHSDPVRHLSPSLPAGLWPRLALAAAVFGLMSILFVEGTDLVHRAANRLVPWKPVRPALGGVLVLGAVAVVGRDYLGLSLPLAADALAGQDTSLTVPLLKLAFTALCLGSGFVGGEVTPLFVIGAATGAALSGPLGIDPVLGATVGFVSVFAAAANTPIACAVMAVELFGWGIAGPAVVACTIAWACGSHRGIYPTQRVLTDDGHVRRRDLRAGP